jgi:acetyl-CoA carboxylase carboxyltransferase component
LCAEARFILQQLQISLSWLKGIGNMFITGPEVIKAVTHEVVDMETLGGATAHTTVSGVAHFAADTEDHAFEITRAIFSYLPSNNTEQPPSVAPTDDPWRMDPELNTIVPLDPSTPYRYALDVINQGIRPGQFL